MGIDPGLCHTGFGLVDADERGGLTHVASGVVSTPPRAPFVDRLLKIHLRIEALIREFRPHHLALEQVFFARNPRSALDLGHARGAVLLSAGLAGIPVFEYAATEAKKAVCSYGGAGKSQVNTMVKALLRLTQAVPDHASDALAVSICHAHSFRALAARAPVRNRPAGAVVLGSTVAKPRTGRGLR